MLPLYVPYFILSGSHEVHLWQFGPQFRPGDRMHDIMHPIRSPGASAGMAGAMAPTKPAPFCHNGRRREVREVEFGRTNPTLPGWQPRERWFSSNESAP